MIQQSLKLYFKEIKLLMPIYSKNEKIFMQDFKTTVNAYVADNPDATIDDVLERFSSPEDVIRDYIAETLDDDKLYKRINTTHIIKRVLLSLLIVALLCAAFHIAALEKIIVEAENHYIDREITAIE